MPLRVKRLVRRKVLPFRVTWTPASSEQLTQRDCERENKDSRVSKREWTSPVRTDPQNVACPVFAVRASNATNAGNRILEWDPPKGGGIDRRVGLCPVSMPLG